MCHFCHEEIILRLMKEAFSSGDSSPEGLTNEKETRRQTETSRRKMDEYCSHLMEYYPFFETGLSHAPVRYGWGRTDIPWAGPREARIPLWRGI